MLRFSGQEMAGKANPCNARYTGMPETKKLVVVKILVASVNTTEGQCLSSRHVKRKRPTLGTLNPYEEGKDCRLPQPFTPYPDNELSDTAANALRAKGLSSGS